MKTLHDAYDEGPDPVREAIRAFGTRHPLPSPATDAEPDWKAAERHFTRIIEVIMGTAPPAGSDVPGTIRRAEHEAIQLLLALNTRPSYRCPICVKQRGSL